MALLISSLLLDQETNDLISTDSNGDNIRVDGTITRYVPSGNLIYGGSGYNYVIFGDSSDPNDDILVLKVYDNDPDDGLQLGNITIFTEIVGVAQNETNTEYLDGMTIQADGNVIFDKEVTIDGDLIIEADGSVTFNSKVTLLNGGNLTITNADKITFGDNSGVELKGGGDLYLQADEIELELPEESIVGTGTVTFKPATYGLDIAIGSPAGAGTDNVLNLETDELATLHDGFSDIVIGEATDGHAIVNAGDVYIGGDDDVLFRDDITIYGSIITVNDASDSELMLSIASGEKLKLDAVSDIIIKNEIYADSVELYSAYGFVAQEDNTVDSLSGEAIRSLELVVTAATGVNLDSIETALLDVQNTTSGDVELFINEARSASGRLTSVQITGDVDVVRLAQTGTGDMKLETSSGSITVLDGTVINTQDSTYLLLDGDDAQGVTHIGGGSITLEANGENESVVVNEAVTSASGDITMVSDVDSVDINDVVSSTSGGAISVTGDSVTQDADISTAGTVSVTADNGSMTMKDGVTTSGTASITYSASGDVALSTLTSDGTVTVTSDSDSDDSGAITDNLTGETANITGTRATLSAAEGIGSADDIDTNITTLDARNTGSGDIAFTELAAGGSLTVNRLAQTDAQEGGVITLTAESGFIMVAASQSGVTAAGSGSIVLTADGGDTGDLVINDGVASTSGTITLRGDNNVSIGIDGDVTSTGGNVEVTADYDDGGMASGVLTMADGAVINAGSGIVDLNADGDITLGSVVTTSDSATAVTIDTAEGAVKDGGDTDAEIVAESGTVVINAVTGIGESSNDLETSIGTLTAVNSTSGGIYLQESDGLVVGGAGVVTQAGDGSIDIDVDAGNLTVDGVVTAHGSGSITFHADGGATGGIIDLNAALSSTSGAIEVSGDEVTQDADVTTGGTVVVTADDGSITMTDGTSTTATGSLTYAATGDIALSKLTGSSLVSVMADSDVAGGGAITDNLTGELDDESPAVNVTASTAVFRAGTGIGTDADDLDLQVGTVAMTTVSGDLNLRNSGSFTVGTVDGLGGATITNGDERATGDDNITITATSKLTISQVVSNADGGDILLAAEGNVADDDLMLDAEVSATGGNGEISLYADDDILQNANISATGSGTISLSAGEDYNNGTNQAGDADGDVMQKDGVLIQSETGAVTVEATEDVALSIISTNGNITVQADDNDFSLSNGIGAISDVLTTLDEGSVASNLIGSTVSLGAATGIGTGSEEIDTTIGTLTATNSTSGGIFILEADDLTIGTGGVATQDGDGSIVVQTTAGTLTVGGGVSAEGDGNILLQAQGSGSDIDLGASVASGMGNLSILAADAVTQGAFSVVTDGGTIDIEATTGSISMNGEAIIDSHGDTGSGNVRLESGTSIAVTGIEAGTASVSLLSGGTVTDAGETSVDIMAGELRLDATDSIGEADGTNKGLLNTTVVTMSASAGSSIFLAESDGVTIGETVAVTVNRVLADGTVGSTVTDAVQEDLITSGGTGSIVLQSTMGDIVLSEGAGEDDGLAVSAASDSDSLGGNILINAVAGSVQVQSGVKANDGNISINAGTTVEQSAAGDITAAASGMTIDVQAVNAITMADGAVTESTDGNIRYEATAGDVTLGELDAGTGDVAVIAGGSIEDLAEDTSTVDITSNDLQLTAGGDIGTSDNHIETRVDNLSSLSTSGSTFVTESDAVTVKEMTLTVERVGSDGDVQTTTADEQEDLTSGGDLVLETVDGSITIEDGADSDGSDTSGITAANEILLQASEKDEDTTASITLEAGVSSSSGNISILGADDISQEAAGDITAAASGMTIDVQAVNAITMADGAVTESTDGNIRYEATAGDVTLGELDAGTGDVAVIAGGSIEDLAEDTSTVDITSNDLQLTAGGDIGTSDNHIETRVDNLSSLSTSGSTFVTESDAVTVKEMTLTVERVGSDGNVQTTTADEQEDLTSGGDLVLETVDGSITIEDGEDDVTDSDTAGMTVGGDILLQASEVDEGTNSGVLLEASLTSEGGNISVLADDYVIQQVAGDIMTLGDGKTIDVQAEDDITMTNKALTSSTDGNIRYESTEGDVTLGELDAGTGDVAVIAGGSIEDLAEDTSTVDITSNDLQLTAGGDIGTSDNHIETRVDNLSGSSVSGSTFVTESDAVTVKEMTLTVERVGSDGDVQTTTADEQEDLTSGGDLVLETVDGSITIEDGADSDGSDTSGITAANEILLQASEKDEDTTASITLEAGVSSSSGNISILGADDISQEAAGDITAAASGMTIDVQAVNAITMADGAVTESTDGNIRYEATAGDVTLGELDAGTGDVAVIAGGSIEDLAEDTSTVDITSNDLQLTAGGDIGTSDNHIETRVDNLSSLSTSGSTFVTESDAVTVKEMTLTVERVGSDGDVQTTTADEQEDLTSGGDLVLETVDGSITIEDGADSDGSDTSGITAANEILLQASEKDEDTTASITLEAGVSSSSGNISILGADDISQEAAGDITAAASGMTIDVQAVNAITMADGAVTESTDGNIRYEATAGDVTLGELDAGTGDVAVIAGGSIEDLAEDTSTVDITSNDLQLTAGGDIGTSDNHIETRVDNLSGSSVSGSTFVTESDAVTVKEMTLTVERVGSDGDVQTTTADEQEDLTSGGDLVLETVDGSITIEDGADSDGSDTSGITAANEILLQASEKDEDTTASITLEAGVSSSSGNISILGADDISQEAAGDITAAASGMTIDVQAVNAITMADGAVTESTDGNIRYEATAGDVTLGELDAGTGDVAVIAGGSIEDLAEDTSTVDITSNDLQLTAGGDIGTSDNHIETRVDNLSSLSTSGSTFVTESDAVTVKEMTLTVERVGSDGDVQTTTADEQEDLTSGGDLVLETVDGSITIEDGADSDGSDTSGITAANEILLQASEKDEDTTASITLEAGVSSSSGNISILGADDISQEAAGDITAAASGMTIDVQAVNAITMADGAVTESTDGNIRYEATAGDVTLGELDAGTGDVAVIAGGSIEDLAEDTSTVDITSNDLQLTAGGDIGTSDNHIETRVDNLSSLSTSGSTFVTESDAVTVKEMTLTVERVGSDGNVQTTTADEQEDLTSGGDLVLESLDGGITTTATTGEVQAKGAIILQAAGADNDVTLGGKVASITGNIAVLAAGSILDGDSDVDIRAVAALLDAGGDIGVSGDPLETDVDILSASSGGSTYITEADGVTIDSVSVSAGASDLEQSDLESGGDLELKVLAGDLVVNEGDDDDRGVTAAGDITFLVSGSDGDIEVNADVKSTGGTLSFDAEGSVTSDADLLSSDPASPVEILSAGGGVTDGTIVITGEDGSSAPADLSVEIYGAGEIENLYEEFSRLYADPSDFRSWIDDFDDGISEDVAARYLVLTPEEGGDSGIVAVTGAEDAVEALIIDVSALGDGVELELDDIDFAVIIGDVTIRGGEGQNYVVGDDSPQNIVLGEDDDTLDGAGGDDYIGSEGGNDELYGGDGNDTVSGGDGNDTIIGGAGDDRLIGGDGIDCAVFSGDRSDYLFEYRESTREFIVTDRRAGSPDGTDILTEVEKLYFEGDDILVNVDNLHASISSDSGGSGGGGLGIALAGVGLVGVLVFAF
ncbi:calcium-binding protein [Prosthecochloris sp. CIB 2401]|uniref:calcium-binding protein n=1 Tax=Prosthecochloris sp. CIB 2401 TaxID=1868325 RepID=UPI00080ABF44|nr:calcium-binding protein [Prosthecochloris sp. CIB 2401]ANT65946.1 Hemolysin IA [Prosthecochloris sp. CIB 2401]